MIISQTFQEFMEELNELEALIPSSTALSLFDAQEWPEIYLGPLYKEVLRFWLKVDTLSKEQLQAVDEKCWAFSRNSPSDYGIAVELAIKSSEGIVYVLYAVKACRAAQVVTDSQATYWATRELLGNVKNPTFLKMFDNL